MGEVRAAGYVGVYFVAFVAAVVFGISIVLVLLSGSGPVLRWVVPISGALLGVALWIELRSDALTAAVFSGVILATAGFCLLLWSRSDPMAPAWTLGSGALLLLAGLGLAAGGYLRMHRGGSEDYPNLLRREVDRRSIYEVSGVQLAAYVAEDEEAGFQVAEVLVQNCFDAPRRVELHFDGYRGFRRETEGFAARAARDLEGGEVAVLDLPVRTGRRGLRLIVWARVAGVGGRRVRPWQAQGLARPLPPILKVLSVFAGIFHLGGGIALRLSPGSHPPPDFQDPVWETIWRPDPVRLMARQLEVR